MTVDKALELAREGDGHTYYVISKAGIVYRCDIDWFENGGTGYTYGFRVTRNKATSRRRPAGEVRWFDLKNMKPSQEKER